MLPELPSIIGEEILVHSLYGDSLAHADANVIFDQQSRQPLTINKDNSLRNVPDILSRGCAEGRRRHEHAFRSTQPHKASDESLYLGPTDSDMRRVALRLDINAV